MRARWLAAALPLVVAGCWLRPAPPTPEALAVRLRDAAVPEAAVRDAARSPAPVSLALREEALAGLALGATPEQVLARYGEPARRDGGWWVYASDAEPAANLRLRFVGARPRLAQIQAWAPSRHETRSLVRVMDPLARVTRKYGPPAATVPWGTGALWLYPAANVGFVVTEAPTSEAPRVAAIVVGFPTGGD